GVLMDHLKNVPFGIGRALPPHVLAIWGLGDWISFFAHSAGIGLVVLSLAGALASAFSGSSGFGIGRRKDPSNRWIFIPLIIIAIAFAWLPPHLDRLDRSSIDGDTIRYLGLIINAIGGFVRLA